MKKRAWKKKVKYCHCGFPQSNPPHNHDARWNPKDYENYYSLTVYNASFKAKHANNGSLANKIDIYFGNCFRTKTEAESVLKKIKKIEEIK